MTMTAKVLVSYAAALMMALMLGAYVHVRYAHAQTHEAAGEGNAIQHVTSHVDVTITGNAAAVGICGANVNRVTAYVSNSGAQIMRVGGTTTDATHGVIIAAGATGVPISATDEIYAFSTVGTTANCLEITR